MDWNLFTTTDYTFLELSSGIGGNKVVTETTGNGILKHRTGMVQEVGTETLTSESTLHIRPSEAFISTVGGHSQLVGHGIRAEGKDYRIIGVTAGTDFDSGSIEFYRATLKREALWDESEFPLE